MAVEQGMVKDEGFSHIQENNRDSMEEWIGTAMQTPVVSHVKNLIDIIPSLRNELAHGSPMLHPTGAASVRICADFINQLYPKK